MVIDMWELSKYIGRLAMQPEPGMSASNQPSALSANHFLCRCSFRCELADTYKWDNMFLLKYEKKKYSHAIPLDIIQTANLITDVWMFSRNHL